jgi:hypothetical protein
MSYRTWVFCVAAWGLQAHGLTAQSFPAEPTEPWEGVESTLRFGDPEQLAYGLEFFPGASYDPAVTTPDAVLGTTLGSRLSHAAEILQCFGHWSGHPRVDVQTYALSHEGRPLIRAVVTAADNHQQLDAILGKLDRLAAPRNLPAATAEQLLKGLPAVAWMGYSIHGDELSGCDAALALAYHLIAGQDEATLQLLQDLVVVIDPCMNPDGRDRIITQVEQNSGLVTTLDHQAMQRGRWPYGRGNHYLFDLNRDWMAGTQPETRGRWRSFRRFHPQLLIDAHEMGSLDTYLFYPQAEPHNPYLPPTLPRWHRQFAADQSQAFDQQGWGYYTREWADAWAPFYSDAWASLNGAVGILYEQSSTSGFPLRRASGQILTYRESVHHQVVSSMANLRTLREHREEILRDYLQAKRRNLDPETPGNQDMLVILPGRHDDREKALLRILLGQGIEVYRNANHVTVRQVLDTLGQNHETLDVPPGAYLVPARQPQGPLVQSYLRFDAPMDAKSLNEERTELERQGSSKIYDATAWSLPLAFALDAYWCRAIENPGARILRLEPDRGVVVAPPEDGPSFAWCVDGSEDRSVRFAAQAMQRGLAVHLADKPFRTAGRAFPRGSLLIRRHENDADVAEQVEAAARDSAVTVFATITGRAPGAGPDLGGGHFHLLERPRVALLGNAPIATDRYGHLWHHLDQEVQLPLAMLDMQQLSGADLRPYNVLILPPGRSSGVTQTLRSMADSLRAWLEAGGTLIACGSSAAALAAVAEESSLTRVRLRRDQLEELDDYEFAADRERRSRSIDFDPKQVYENPAAATTQPEEDGQSEPKEPTSAAKGKARERVDRWQRRFAPAGVFLRAFLREDHWLTAGCGSDWPLYFTGSYAFLSKAPTVTPVRLAAENSLRISGLLWPEARERLANSAAVTVERIGNGQVILFAATPAFRGYLRGSGRLFANAVVYGPGVGANPPVK